LDKPIHNKITSVGLDFLLTFDGNSDKFYHYNGNHIDQDRPRKAVMAGDGKYGNAHRCGACHYLKIGTDGSPTQFTDTDLHATVGGLSATKKTGGNYCGTYFDYDNDTILSRISHVSKAVESDTTVREIGYFGRGYDIDSGELVSEPMFSRIVLDQSIALLAGESLTTCYELRFTFNMHVTETSIFNGYTDPYGNPLRCFCKSYITRAQNSLKTWGTGANFSFCFNNNGDLAPLSVSGSSALKESLICGTGIGTSYDMNFSYSTTDADFPNNGSAPSLSTCPISVSFKHYTGIGNNDKYRDFNVVIDFNQPEMTNAITDPAETFIDIKRFMLFGKYYRLGYYEEDGTTWHSQALRKYANQKLVLTHRLRFSTPDTI
jgi:hypothetical protein